MVFDSKPILVFWETTRACPLSCQHCRASAITEPLPGELSTEEGRRLIDQVTAFGKPYPTLIFTGGDPLKRNDIFDLLLHAVEKDMHFALSPAVSELLNQDVLRKIKRLGASSISISLDSSNPSFHDMIRGRPGTFERTVGALKNASNLGLEAQVNTTIMKDNLDELPQIFHLIKGLNVKTWEIFFLIRVGRGTQMHDLDPEESETACNLLYDASRLGMTVRTVEAPFIRRVSRLRKDIGDYWSNVRYDKLRSELYRLEGEPTSASTLRPKGTLDGDGIIFVGYDGNVYPGGLLPVSLGNVRRDQLSKIYRENALIRNIRERNFEGECGICAFKDACGGSRARSYAYAGNPLSSDPACIHALR